MNALQSLHNGALTGKREQSIYTPQCIVDALLRLWPEGIACDPCWGPGSIVPATIKCRAPGAEEEPAWLEPTWEDGLRFPFWPARTYVNPPYDDLQPWIERFHASWECVLLTPVRTHRKWWRPLLQDHYLRCWLNPIKFIGYAQTFPAPLVLVYNGSRGAFYKAFEGLGDVH